MSKWTIYQLLIILSSGILIALNHLFTESISVAFAFVERWIPSSILIIFFTIVLIIWGVAFILLLQEKKDKLLFVHKIWRIMPAIIGVVLFISVVVFLWLGMTVLSDVSPDMHGLLNVIIVYFLVLFYFLVLSIFIRYSNISTSKGKILSSANTAVLILIFVLFFLPAL